MNFNDILKKGEDALKGEDGKINYKDLQKDAQDAYKTYSSTEGSYQDKASAAYSSYQKSHASSGNTEKTEGSTEEEK